MPSFNYMNGLVSTGNQIPFTILKRIFSKRKKILINFIHIFFWRVDKDGMMKYKKQSYKNRLLVYVFYNRLKHKNNIA